MEIEDMRRNVGILEGLSVGGAFSTEMSYKNHQLHWRPHLENSYNHKRMLHRILLMRNETRLETLETLVEG